MEREIEREIESVVVVIRDLGHQLCLLLLLYTCLSNVPDIALLFQSWTLVDLDMFSGSKGQDFLVNWEAS